MDFCICEDDKTIYELILSTSKKKLNFKVFDDDESSRFAREKWDICAELGIMGLPVPKEYGGLERNMLTTALGVIALSRGCSDEGLVFSICAHICTCAVPLMIHGTKEQKEEVLTRIALGKWIGGNGMTEADAGSDVSSIGTTVKKEKDKYIINGAKLFVTNAPVADVLIIYARHPKGIKMADISAFIITRNDNGWNIGQVFKKMGLRTSTMGEVVLDNCIVGESAVVGRERLGIRVFNDSMIWERIVMSAYHVGAMERQFEKVKEYAYSRTQFGKKIVEYQDVSSKLVGMIKRIECAKMLLYKACWKYDRQKASLADAAMVKLAASEAKVKNSIEALQIMGAYGYIKGSEIEKQLRDSVASRIYSGTSEMQKRIITNNIDEFCI